MLDVAIRTVALTLSHFLWQGVLIGAFAAAALRARVARTAQGRYVVCLVALLACVVAPIVTATFICENAAQPGARTDGPPTGASGIQPLASLAPHGPSGHTTVYLASVHSIDWMSAGVLLWLMGALLMAAYYVMQWFGVDAIRRSALPLLAPDQLLASAVRLLSQWNATARVSVMISHAVTTPIVLGIWRPMIIFPAATIARMSVSDFELILLHEMAHIIRRDALVNALQVVLEIALFYHPVVHWLSRRARVERECACDEFVVRASGSAYRYAQALTTLALTSARSAPLSLGAAGGDLLLRLKNLARDEPEDDTLPRSRAQLLVLGLLLVFWLSVYAPGATWWGFADEPVLATHKGASTAPLARVAETTAAVPIARLPDTRFVLNTNTDSLAEDSARARRARVIRSDRTSVALAEPHLAQINFAQPSLDIPTIESTQQPGTAISGDEVDRAGPAASVAEMPTPIYNPMPEYPVRARLDGIQGSVVASLRVGPDGRATGLRVTEATPVGVFEGAVRRSLMRWRYDVAATTPRSSNMIVSYRLNFSLDGVSSAVTSVCATATASRTCEPQ